MEIKLTTYCGSVHDNRPLKGGHCTRFWCSQDKARKKPSKLSENPTAKRRDNVGMKRYHCRSAMSVKYKRNKNAGYDIFINLQHHVHHVLYDDIRMPPEALQMIQEQAEWSTPAAMVYGGSSVKLSGDEMMPNCHQPRSFWLNSVTTLTFSNQSGYRMVWRCLHGE